MQLGEPQSVACMGHPDKPDTLAACRHKDAKKPRDSRF